MSNKGIRVIFIPLISFLFLFGCPFTISADNTLVPTFSSTTIQSDWNDYGGHLTEYHESSNSNTGISKLNFSFNNHYYGMVSITYYFGSSTYSYGDVFIADGYGEFYYRNSSGTYNYVTAVRIDYIGLVIPDSNVDLTQIIQLLNAIEGHTGENVIEVQNVLDELIEANGYLETLTKLRQWNFPMESFGIISSFYLRGQTPVVDVVENTSFQYPVFEMKPNTLVQYNSGIAGDYYLILAIDRNIINSQTFLTAFQFNMNITIKEYDVIHNIAFTPQSNGVIVKLVVNVPTSGTLTMTNIYSITYHIIPIYWNRINNLNISTDFALTYNLNNRLLNDLDIIANGTTQSNSAAGSNDTATNEFEGIAGDMYDYEDSFNSDMNSSLSQIDTNFNIGSQFGSKFSSSAQWVSQQFNTMTASTPFGSVISFSLLLGLALLIIGKVLR